MLLLLNMHAYCICTGGSVAQVALAWLLRQPSVVSIVIGARTLAQLEDNLKAVELKLSEEQVKVPP